MNAVSHLGCGSVLNLFDPFGSSGLFF